MLYYLILSNNRTPQEIILAFVFMLVVYFISLSVHEFAHGFVAYKMGDDTPKLAGRLTLNPIAHIDPMGLLSFMLVGIGWAKPMPINPIRFKKYRTGMRLVSISGVVANFLLGLLAALVNLLLVHTVGFPSFEISYLYLFLSITMIVNGFLVLYNILPIYPLDGFNFISTFFKKENKFLTACYKNGFKILFSIIFISLIIEVLTTFDILGWYLNLLYNYVYLPISWLGVF